MGKADEYWDRVLPLGGSPGIVHPPMQASHSPNGRSGVEAPRRGESYGILSIAEYLGSALSHQLPASSITTFAPALVS